MYILNVVCSTGTGKHSIFRRTGDNKMISMNSRATFCHQSKVILQGHNFFGIHVQVVEVII